MEPPIQSLTSKFTFSIVCYYNAFSRKTWHLIRITVTKFESVSVIFMFNDRARPSKIVASLVVVN